MADSSSPSRTASDGQIWVSSLNTAVDERKAENAQPRVRRRNRIISSCLECRRRKLRCDRGQPCSNCARVSRQCHLIAPGFDAAAQARLAEVKEKMGILERSLEQDIAQRNRAQTDPSPLEQRHATMVREETYSEEEEEADIKDLKSSEYAREDSAYYEDEEGDDDMVDLGIAMGKLSQALKELPRRETQNPNAFSTGVVDWMMPSADYVAPSSSFFAPGAERRTLMNYLPTRSLVDKLMAQYWQAVHVVARAVHRPSFERHYEKFWKDTDSVQQRKSWPRPNITAVTTANIPATKTTTFAQPEFWHRHNTLSWSYAKC
ncbi:hypothetical protein EJ07DRAFT_153415 [Lizonia empirigonia]|nr:hypothetical protein EJ07DRAFT_153415 [Lizonia empirigonia]